MTLTSRETEVGGRGEDECHGGCHQTTLGEWKINIYGPLTTLMQHKMVRTLNIALTPPLPPHTNFHCPLVIFPLTLNPSTTPRSSVVSPTPRLAVTRHRVSMICRGREEWRGEYRNLFRACVCGICSVHTHIHLVLTCTRCITHCPSSQGWASGVLLHSMYVVCCMSCV